MVKNAIKRGQSRTCSSYAEREHFRRSQWSKMRLSEGRVELVRAMPSVSILGEANGQWSMINGQWSMINVQCSMVNVQWSMFNGQCSMVNVQWSMINVQWSMVNGQWPMVNDSLPRPRSYPYSQARNRCRRARSSSNISYIR